MNSLKMKSMNKKPIQQYMAYRGDKFIGIGNAKEIAHLMGFKRVDTVYRYATPSMRKILDKTPLERRIIIERVENA